MTPADEIREALREDGAFGDYIPDVSEIADWLKGRADECE